MALMVVEVDLNDKIIFIDKLLDHHVIHVYQNPETKIKEQLKQKINEIPNYDIQNINGGPKMKHHELY